ncbi:MAG: hypothetical protein JWR44_1114 [Hymenobacter sp.]|jgi:hypothetical protein|nr:hypothetical protein [Hymenobacter sp.]
MKALLSERFALHGLLTIFLTTTVFHVLVLVGVIPFGMVWGGRLRDHSQMVTFEAVSLAVTLLMLAVVGVRAGYVKIRIHKRVVQGVLWLMMLLFLANTVGNLLSENEFEKMVFTPLTLLLALFSLRAAVGTASTSTP